MHSNYFLQAHIMAPSPLFYVQPPQQPMAGCIYQLVKYIDRERLA